MTRPKAHLFTCYRFVCDGCGRYVYVDPVPCELSPEERDEVEEYGMEPGVHGDWVVMPTVTTCPHCQTEHDTECDDGPAAY